MTEQPTCTQCNTANFERQQLFVAECAKGTLAILANLNMAGDMEELAGRLWFLEGWAAEHHRDVAPRLHEAVMAAVTLSSDAVTAVRDLVATLPDPTD